MQFKQSLRRTLCNYKLYGILFYFILFTIDFSNWEAWHQKFNLKSSSVWYTGACRALLFLADTATNFTRVSILINIPTINHFIKVLFVDLEAYSNDEATGVCKIPETLICSWPFRAFYCAQVKNNTPFRGQLVSNLVIGFCLSFIGSAKIAKDTIYW